MLFDLKVLNSALAELEQEKGISKEKVLDAIEHALAAAYKKEYGKKGQIIRAQFDLETGNLSFSQIKIVVDDSVVYDPEDESLSEADKEGKTRFNPEHHILLDAARLIKSDVELDDEIEFPLETKEDFGRIAAQTAKQVIMQKIRAAEREASIKEFGEKVGQIVSGYVQRFERGRLFVDLGKAIAVLPYEEQIPGERYRQGERIRALLYKLDPEARGSFIKLSRTRPEFLVELFKLEAPELASGTVEIKTVVREPGRRSKIAAYSIDERIDPVGTLVGARGVRVSTVTSELGGEKIDIVEWTDDEEEMIARALSPAEVLDVEITDKEARHARVEVDEEQQSLAIGKKGQNVRLAAKLVGYKIDIVGVSGNTLASSDGEEVELSEEDFSQKSVENTQDAEQTEEVLAEEAGSESGNTQEVNEDGAEKEVEAKSNNANSGDNQAESEKLAEDKVAEEIEEKS